jgi:hypothetical protein
MSDTIKKMLRVWAANSKRDTSVLADAIERLAGDPIAAADLIAEACQKDASVAVSDDVMDEINSLAVDSLD